MTRRFKAQESTVTKDLVSVMKKMKARNLRVDKQLMGDGVVKIIFDRNGKRYVFKCDNYKDQLDNYRAAQLCISYLYSALESYGVSQEESLMEKVFENFFLGFQATPNDDVLLISDGNSWYQILGVNENCAAEDIKSAYKTMAKIHHPDVGGNNENYLKLRAAYEEGMELKQ